MPDLDTILKASEPSGTTVETPSGLSIYYQSEPERLYRVNGVEVPSVTTVLGVLHKPALIWWGMKVGVEGVTELYQADTEYHELVKDCLLDRDTGTLIDALKTHKLTVNHVRDKAGSRGTSVHNAFERYCLTGHKPIPEEFPEEERGYVEGLVKFIEAVNPEPIECEVMVGSARYGYAGRFDLVCRTEAKEVQVGPRTKRLVPAGRGLVDLKTSKGAYVSHELQLAAYEEASIESGYEKTNYQAVVLAKEDGSFDFKVSRARFHHFLDVKRCHDTMKVF